MAATLIGQFDVGQTSSPRAPHMRGMTTFDESKHDRDVAGKFTEMAGTEQQDSLAAPIAVADACARCDRPATSDDGLCDKHTTRWGELTIREGSRTPWGVADNVTNIAPGMAIASTPGHGGMKLSPERNALIPPALRNASGWYEEDCEINIPLHYFPEEWVAQDWVTGSADKLQEDTDASIKRWFPDKWEKANGRELEQGESYEKDRRTWLERHAAEVIVTSARNAETNPDMVRVTARIGGQGGAGEECEYLVPKAEYEARREATEPGQDGRFVVDPKRHPKLPAEQKSAKTVKPTVHIDPHSISVSALSQAHIDGAITATARDRVAKDLGKRWRRADGSVESLRDIIETGVAGKTAYTNGASIKYAILQEDPERPGTHFSLSVSKATFDYFDEIPDDRSPASKAYQSAHTYQERLDRKDGGVTRAEQERSHHLYAEARRLREAEEAERLASEGSVEEKAAARKRALADRERAATISA